MASPSQPDFSAPAAADDCVSGAATRPGWNTVITELRNLSAEELARHHAQLGSQLRANGIAFSAASLNQVETRPWPLDLLPQVIEATEWQPLRDGLNQRARLKKALLADLYGRQQVLLDGVLPAAAVQVHAGYLRNARHLPGTTELPLYCVDVSRSPAGDWYVNDDHCQAPDGIGYTLENRLVLSHVLPGLFRKTRVQRVAGWFRALQTYLSGVIDTDARCVMLAYGASHPHYFEHVYLAKYLGYTLVELNDLTVRNERVWLKTVDGLQRVDVILRLIADCDIDPLAINRGSAIGIPGLLHALLAGTVHLINPLGAAVLENPAFNAYLPALCRYYLDEPVQLPGTPTFWLGDAAQRAHALENVDDLVFRDINAAGQILDPRGMDSKARTAMLRDIDLLPARYVAEQRIDRLAVPELAAAAVGADASDEPRRITLRAFLLDQGPRFEVMTGGLGLLDRSAGEHRPGLATLDGSRDVWVLSTGPVQPDTLLPAADDGLQYAMLEGELPSRVADNLFWLGRYAEKAEHLIRVMRAVFTELTTDDSPVDADAPTAAQTTLVRALILSTGSRSRLPSLQAVHPAGSVGDSSTSDRTGDRSVTETAAGTTDPGAEPAAEGTGTSRGNEAGIGAGYDWQLLGAELQSLLLDEQRIGSLPHSLQQVQRTASVIRDRISPEILRVLNELDDRRGQTDALQAQPFGYEAGTLNATIDYLNGLLTGLAALTGLTSENLTRGDGWRFLMLGRRLERARLGSATLGYLLQQRQDDPRELETLLRLFDSVITYRSRYRSRIDSRRVLHLLMLDETNPRSVAFQFLHVDTLIRELPGMRRASYQEALLRLATAGLSRVRLADASHLLAQAAGQRQSLPTFCQRLESITLDLGGALSAAYFTHTEAQSNLDTAQWRAPATTEAPGPGAGAPPQADNGSGAADSGSRPP